MGPSPKKFPNRIDELARNDWFSQCDIGSQLGRNNEIIGIAYTSTARDRNDLGFGSFASNLQDRFDAVLFRHDEISNDDARQMRMKQFHPF